MTGINEQPDGARGQVSRRAVVTAAAWSVPAIVIATAAPAAATQSGTLKITKIVGKKKTGIGNIGNVTFTVTYSGTSPGAHVASVALPNNGLIGGILQGWSPRTQNVNLPALGQSQTGTVTFNSKYAIILSLIGVNPPSSVTITAGIATNGHQAPTPLAVAIS